MKRRLTKVVVFLLLGAIVNVAVAWGCAVSSDAESPLSPAEWFLGLKPSGGDSVWWQEHANKRFDTPLLLADHLNGRGVDIRLLTGANPEHVYVEYEPIYISYQGWNRLRGDDLKPERLDRALVLTAGWPRMSLRAIRWDTQISRGQRGFEAYEIKEFEKFSVDVELISYSFAVPILGNSSERVLPLRPIWRGFAINTIFYAAILWLLTLGPFTARRMIRRKRGHCIKCGYDLRGHSGGEVCPECGVEDGPAAVASS